MNIILVALATLYLLPIQCECVQIESDVVDIISESSSTYEFGDPLFLTPYIENGSVIEAREAAEVSSEYFENLTSYSGFLTVNKTFNKNLFIWFVPSPNFDDPLILWLQGGPGLTSLFGLFEENGPFYIENDKVELRNHSWTKTHNVLYIDNPVGTGYSYTNEGGIPHNEIQIGEELYEALRQFFLLFPELRENDFFITGESYAGKYVPVISDTVFRKNSALPDEFKINLRGLAIGNGWLDPVNQMNMGEYAYQHGLVDTKTKKIMDQYRDQSIVLLHEGKFTESTIVQREITKVFRNATGFENLYNYLIPEKQETEANLIKFLQKKEVRKAIHVGNLTFNPDQKVDDALLGDIMISVADILADLLENFPVLIYSGQLDLAVPYPTTVNYLEKLKFSAAQEYRTADRKIWYRQEEIVGYVKSAGYLTELMIMGAGHLVPADQPEVAHAMIYSFTRNRTVT